MPGGDQPGCSGSETPDQKTGESTIDIQSEQKEKPDVMSDPESSKSDPSSVHESESGSGLQTPDLTPDCSSSFQSELKEKSTSIEVPLEDKEISGALTDSEISKSDPSAESDSGSGLHSPDLKPDTSQDPTFEPVGTGQTREKEAAIPVNKSCATVISEVESPFSPDQGEFLDEEENIEMQPIAPQVENEEAVEADRLSITELFQKEAAPTEGSSGQNAVRPPTNRKWKYLIGGIVLTLFGGGIIAMGIMLSKKSPGNPLLNVTVPDGTFLPIEIKAILNLDD